MLKYLRFIIPLLFCLSANVSLSGQETVLSLPNLKKYSSSTVKEALQNLAADFKVVFSYSSNYIDVDRTIYFTGKERTLEQLLERVLDGQSVNVQEGKQRRILLIPLEEPEWYTLKGYVVDKQSGEPLIGAILRDANTQNGIFTNEQGYFSLKLEPGETIINVSYLGYLSTRSVVNISKDHFRNFELTFNNELNPIVIHGLVPNNPNTGGSPIPIKFTDHKPTLFGKKDIFLNIRTEPGILSPNEGTGGYFVRGGNFDQNLVLFENVPMYEVGHVGGLSSIFIDDAIQNAEFHKEGFPARYGGRLSSVLNVQLKDGNKIKHKGSIGIGVLGVQASLDGPLFEDIVTFNIAGRTSWLDIYANDLFSRLLDNDRTGINYFDANSKIVFNLSSTSKLSLSTYNGNDGFAFSKINDFQGESSDFNLSESNSLIWGNRLVSLNFSQVVGDQLFANVHLSRLNYKSQSRGSYVFSYEDTLTVNNQEFEVWAFSGIKDLNIKTNLDYYWRKNLKLKFGLGWTSHEYNPTIQQRDELDLRVGNIYFEGDSSTFSSESFAYIEANWQPDTTVAVYGGVRLNDYRVRSKNYLSLEPRLSIHYNYSKNHRLEFSYTKMSQFVHLLVNPGTGLPSDLWVPSTENIKPEIAHQISFGSSSFFFDQFNLYAGAYYKKMYNLLEYREEADIYYGIINGSDGNEPVFNTTNDWEENVLPGIGEAAGLEFKITKNEGRLKWELAYTLASSKRQFEGINDGKKYPHKYDRRHDFFAMLNFDLNDYFNIATSWTYSSGSNFSLAIENFPIPGGDARELTGRNNYRLPNYHHLDIGLNWNRQYEMYGFSGSIGVYNVYNRFNPFYVYLYDNPANKQTEVTGVGLFPILPYLTFKINF